MWGNHSLGEIKSNFNHYLLDTFKSFVAKEIPGKKKKVKHDEYLTYQNERRLVKKEIVMQN